MQVLAKLTKDKNRIKVAFPYSKTPEFEEMVNKVKATKVAAWRGTGKYWSLKLTLETIEFLLSVNAQISNEDNQVLLVKLIEIEKQQDILSLREQLSRAKSAEQIIHEGLNYKPRAFQNVPNSYFYISEHGFILGDDMGLGKTVESIQVTLDPKAKFNSVLIIVPPMAIGTWIDELNDKFGITPFVITKELKNPVPKYKYYLISYFQLHKAKGSFDCIIWDEAQFIKNKSNRTTESKRVAKESKYRMFLTGTPIMNDHKELYTYISLLDPNCITEYDFKKDYCGAEWKYVTRKINGKLIKKKYLDCSGNSNPIKLSKYLYQNMLIRRTKSEVLDQLPPKTRQTIFLSNKAVSGTSAFELYQNSSIIKMKDPLFLEWLSNTLKSTSDKVLIFTFFRDMQTEIGNLLDQLNIKYLIINGDTSQAKREEYKKQFNENSDIQCFLLSIGCAALNLNLQVANIVIFPDLYYVPPIMEQAEDRCYRIGQTKPVMVYYPISTEFEYKMLTSLMKKLKVIKQLLDGKVSIMDNGKDSLLIEIAKDLGIPVGKKNVSI